MVKVAESTQVIRSVTGEAVTVQEAEEGQRSRIVEILTFCVEVTTGKTRL